MSTFEIELFKKQLRETIIWCLMNFSEDDKIYSLRTPPIPPEFKNYQLKYKDDEIFEIIHATVQEKREHMLRWNERYQEASQQYDANPDKLAGGRLLMMCYCSTCDGTSSIETSDFIDACDVPPWDTWVHLEPEPEPSYAPFLISWIPYQMINVVETAIAVNALEVIWWIEDVKNLIHKSSSTEAIQYINSLFMSFETAGLFTYG